MRASDIKVLYRKARQIFWARVPSGKIHLHRDISAGRWPISGRKAAENGFKGYLKALIHSGSFNPL
ncbi:hypothetical protein [Atopobium sp. oral taxon 416]|uniref:hypothetical protein n=1 Tax=Atopobium sp. oral taxon 416 TaxID=712157 RepID=UPI001BA60527|nr:hypothetical protein [Atopobium sp. oral taxon 416]QUC04371.1 hypothetical protein J4859_05420 [Atopobium sp. oral taxon 416]